MKHTTQRLLALLLIPCLILGLFLATPKTVQAESQALSIYVGEKLKNAFSNNVSRVTNSNPAVVEVSYNGNQISFKGIGTGGAVVSVWTTATTVSMDYIFTVKDNANLFSVTYKMELPGINQYVYEIKNKSNINFTQVEFDCYDNGRLLDLGDAKCSAYVLPAKGTCIGTIMTDKKLSAPKKIGFRASRLIRGNAMDNGKAVPKNAVTLKVAEPTLGKSYRKLRLINYKMTVTNTFEQNIGYEIYGYVYNSSGKMVGFIDSALEDKGTLNRYQKRTNKWQYVIIKSSGDLKCKAWVNALPATSSVLKAD
ncbi:MAG: hypothetical protein IJ679_10910 [Lachnospiraceae bacterium]|nr:hypothetical protein [Lachnospiraceae bacterium]